MPSITSRRRRHRRQRMIEWTDAMASEVTLVETSGFPPPPYPPAANTATTYNNTNITEALYASEAEATAAVAPPEGGVPHTIQMFYMNRTRRATFAFSPHNAPVIRSDSEQTVEETTADDLLLAELASNRHTNEEHGDNCRRSTRLIRRLRELAKRQLKSFGDSFLNNHHRHSENAQGMEAYYAVAL